MRGIAALSIVWLHTFGGGDWARLSFPGRFAVPFFTATSVFLIFQSVTRKPHQTFGRYAISRLKRIYVPFVIWTVFYLLIMSIGAVIKHSPLPTLNVQLLWIGSTHHLWFLPYILIVSLLTFLAAKINVQRIAASVIAIVCFVTGSVIAFKMLPVRKPSDYGLLLAMDAIPAMFWTWALMFELRRRKQHLCPHALRAIISAVLGLGYLIALWFCDRHRGMENASGFAALVCALSLSIQAPRWLLQFGSMAYGIYLVHILFLEGFQDICTMVNLPTSLTMDLVTFVISTVCSIVFCMIVSHLPGCRWLGVEPANA